MFINRAGLLNLLNISGIGSMRLRSLIAKFKSTENIFKASQRELIIAAGVDQKTAQKIKLYKDFKFGKNQLEKAKSLGAKITTFWDADYPDSLRKISDPPVIFFVMGEVEKVDEIAISLVGTRQPSCYGKIVTEKFARELCGLGFTIVSGLARGVDTIAHSVTLDHGGRTIAVIGSGLDVFYPPENRGLFHRIARNGAVISEYAFGSAPDAANFPKRNRIIAALSMGTIVAEADFKSGAIITSNFALDYNKEVFCVPGNITSNKSRGCNSLIKEGAKLIMDVNDIVEELSPKLSHTLNRNKLKEKVANLSSSQLDLLQKLSNDKPIHVDELARILSRSTNSVLADLLTLEFDDMVKQLPGKLFLRM